MDFLVPFDSYLKEYRYKYLALFHALRSAIVAGNIPNGTKLPSSREMSGMYQLSRGSVNQVYDMLLAEGYVTAAVGRGTYVNYEAPDRLEHDIPVTEQIRLSDWGERISCEGAYRTDALLAHEATATSVINLEMGQPVQEGFPVEAWCHAMYQEVRQLEALRQDSEPIHPAGYEPLREAIALHLRRMRGIQARGEQVFIFNGSMQAIALLMQLLVNPGDGVVVESPGYGGIQRAIEAAGGILIANAVDEQGIIVREWTEKLLFVTPSRQFPTGAVLSLERRQQLLAWAARHKAIIIEDDYDSEIRYGGRPIEPLKTLDQEDRVVYIGTFSKTMYNGLRIGYAVLPTSLIKPMERAKQLYEPSPTSVLEQRALAAFIQNGHYERHLRRLRRIYSKKYAYFYRMMQEHVGHLFNIISCDAGMHIYAIWNGDPEAYEAFRLSAAKEGVRWSDGRRFHLLSNAPATACFGFAHLQEEDLLRGVLRMKTAWEKTKYVREPGSIIKDQKLSQISRRESDD
ncbi:transcriptional regulator [Paenibacillus selenitireducens]|uniref:Transcriptional regulator n=1 Tax=Paenibacillus selenitireducens TaxID=1324314 RepID=A0A1T2XJV3_9BACL|nr:PLP-dependent aminotransferase family protein [Paenibacillus selenitireducens]OPA80151.1 transcriptional regulator [Paenibacillus selenitireducens]